MPPEEWSGRFRPPLSILRLVPMEELNWQRPHSQKIAPAPS